MATVVELDESCVRDVRLADYFDLTDMQLRMASEPERGLFLAEGDKVIKRALAAGIVPRSALMTPKWWPALAPGFEGHDVEVFLAPQPVLEQVVGFRLHRGALASFRRPERPTVAQAIEGARRIAVLEDLVDHTNVGAIFRCASALGVDAVLVSPACADPLYRRSVKVSMGAVFSIPWTYAEPWPWVLDDLRAQGFTCLSLTPDPSAVDIKDVAAHAPTDRLALMLGTEGPGLTQHSVARSDLAVRIPMSHGVDSLNVAAASAVAFYALV